MFPFFPDFFGLPATNKLSSYFTWRDGTVTKECSSDSKWTAYVASQPLNAQNNKFLLIIDDHVPSGNTWGFAIGITNNQQIDLRNDIPIWENTLALGVLLDKQVKKSYEWQRNKLQ